LKKDGFYNGNGNWGFENEMKIVVPITETIMETGTFHKGNWNIP
jgi:hypothetical protein